MKWVKEKWVKDGKGFDTNNNKILVDGDPPVLTHSLSMHPLSIPENIRKPYGFLMFSGVGKGCIRNQWVNIESKLVPILDLLRKQRQVLAVSLHS